MKNVILFILSMSVFYSCNNKVKNKTFELSKSMISLIEKDNSCLELINDGFGVDTSTVKDINYIETLLGKVILENEGVKYQRLIFLRTYEGGEIINTSKVTFGLLENGSGILKNYYSENKNKKVESKEIQDFDIDFLYDKIGDPQNKISSGRTKVFIIDFKSEDNFECKLYDNLPSNIIEEIKNLNIWNDKSD